ncbi:MAG: DUF6516 family protein [Euryarchaeota archaeon]|nr:DUF6516 family protein [Euryarchaeota archaeon]
MKILKQSKIVAKTISIDFDGTAGYSTLKIRVKLINHWYLQVWEHETPVTRRYAYHVFNGDTMVVRWDNAPHHRGISTFPHHKHADGVIIESEEMQIDGALAEIKKMM